MMQIHMSGSAHQARAILGAWHSGDADRLHVELGRAQKLHAMDSAEEERLELLAEIAREMSATDAGADDPVYGSLLAHLAFVGPRSARPRYRRRAASASSLQ
jgi:hypothetical protein